MEYVVSIRIVFPQTISKVLKREKDRFVTKYGSSYKSDPHITLYLGRYTKLGFPKLIRDLQSLEAKPFTISLTGPRLISNKTLHHNLFVVNMTNKRQIHTLQKEVFKMDLRYRSLLLRQKDQERFRKGLYGKIERDNFKRYGQLRPSEPFDPHITLGDIGFEKARPSLVDVQRNLKAIRGKKVRVSGITVFFYGKRTKEEKAMLLEEITIPLR